MPIRFFVLVIASWLGLLLFLSPPLQAQSGHRPQQHHLPPGDAVATVLPWLYQQYPALLSTGSELQLRHDLSSPGGRHLTFWQTYQGTPVQGGLLKVNLGQQGRVWSTAGQVKGFTQVGQPNFSFDTLRLRQRYGEVLGARRIAIERVWWVENDQLRAAYRLETHQPGTEPSYQIWVDAQSGTELRREGRSAYLHPQQDSSGRGRVFYPDPCTRANLTYGTQFSDQDDQHSPIFEALMDTVVLRDLTVRNDTFFLQGPYVQIVDLAFFNVAPATSLTGDFFFDRSDPGFEDVMCYYHIDRYQRYVQSISFTNLQRAPLRVDSHGKGNSDQSSYTPDAQGGYLLFGDGGVDDAEDADVIIHEYGHALSEAAAPGTRSGLERRGLDEGICDYLAASYSYDLDPWRWYEIFNWDGHNEFWPGRQGVSQLSYPPNNTSIYRYGELWAATLMQIRQEIGATVTDRLVLQELYGNFPGMTLPDAARLMIEADSMLYQGQHSGVLLRYFCERNLIMGNTCSAVNLPAPPQPTAWQLLPAGPNRWRLLLQGGEADAPAQWTLYDLQGRKLQTGQSKAAGHGHAELHFPQLTQGWYLLQVRSRQASQSFRLRVFE